MPLRKDTTRGPLGGFHTGPRARRAWRWQLDGALVSAPQVCRREHWYLALARLQTPGAWREAPLGVRFLDAQHRVLAEQCLALRALPGQLDPRHLRAWVQTPDKARFVQLHFGRPDDAARFAAVWLHPTAERDPKCHPAANVPRWDRLLPATRPARVLVPTALAGLAEVFAPLPVEVVAFRSAAKLRAAAHGSLVVLDAAAVLSCGLTLDDLETMAADAWLVVDLLTAAYLLRTAGAATTRVTGHTARHELMSARVEYSDMPTRGFALQDVFPYGTLTDGGAFHTRVLTATASYKRWADRTGCATLLASETPFAQHCGDVLLAAWPGRGGEVFLTDLPWLIAEQGPALLAPDLMRHTLRMLGGLPLDDAVEYWCRWDDASVVLRDIADLPRRFPEIRTVRWLADDPTVAHLGLTVAGRPRPRRHVMICTGCADQAAWHDGLAPEPLILFMKWLAREVREQTPWAARYLADLRVTWQFDATTGLRRVEDYASAAGVAEGRPDWVVRLRSVSGGGVPGGGVLAGGGSHPSAGESLAPDEVVDVTIESGVLGAQALAYQAWLTRRLRGIIEEVALARGSAAVRAGGASAIAGRT